MEVRDYHRRAFLCTDLLLTTRASRALHILFVTSNRLGDAVLSTGVLGALAERYPGADVTVLCGPIPAPLFHGAPNVARIVPFRKRRYGLHWLKAWHTLVGVHYGLVVDMRESALGYLLGSWRVKRRVVDGGDLHAVEEAASILGLAPAPAPRLWVEDAARRETARWIDPERPLLAIGPTANFAGKQWPIQGFQAVARRLSAPDGALPGAQVAVFGAANEREQALPLIQDPNLAILDLVGRPSLGEVAALLERAALFIGNDSGLMHMAAAVGCPTVGIFGPSNPTRYRPYGPNAVAVTPDRDWIEVWRDFFERGKPAEEIMLGVDPDRVSAAAGDLLARRETETVQ